MEPGRQRAEAWLADCTRAQREADRNAQEPAQEGAGGEIGGQARLAGSREPIAAQEGSGAARACACACPALDDARDRAESAEAAYAYEHRLRAAYFSRARRRAEKAEGLLRECPWVLEYGDIRRRKALAAKISKILASKISETIS